MQIVVQRFSMAALAAPPPHFPQENDGVRFGLIIFGKQFFVFFFLLERFGEEWASFKVVYVFVFEKGQIVFVKKIFQTWRSTLECYVVINK